MAFKCHSLPSERTQSFELNVASLKLSPTTSHTIPSTWSEFAWPANQHPKITIKKSHKPLRTSWILQKMFRPCLIIVQSCYFDYRINKSFAYSRCMICVSCTADLDALHAQGIMVFIIMTNQRGRKIQSHGWNSSQLRIVSIGHCSNDNFNCYLNWCDVHGLLYQLNPCKCNKALENLRVNERKVNDLLLGVL